MTFDRLTQLYYYDDFKEEAQKIIRNLEDPCMLITMNFSNFKYINSVYGYEKGDKLLADLAEHFFHNNEYCILASRVHSDRFAALIKISQDVDMSVDMTRHYDLIHKQYMKKLEKDFPMAVIHINSGAYVIRDPEENISQILDKAEIARRSIRDNYQESICFFSSELEARVKLESSIIPLLERSAKEDTIQVYLQPKINIDTQQVIGAEALARMVGEDGRLIPPGIFVPVLERYGMITQLDAYVASTVIGILEEWKEKGYTLIPISLNLSRVDFNRAEEWSHAIEEIEASEIPKKYVEFEVTETVFFEDLTMIIDRVRALRDKGYRISMDDFGTGFSSLNTLGMLPLDIIKFDRGFVQNSINSSKGREIMSGLVDIFKRINLEVICEGVETCEEERIIRACGCESVQGFLYDRPIPIKAFEEKYLSRLAEE